MKYMEKIYDYLEMLAYNCDEGENNFQFDDDERDELQLCLEWCGKGIGLQTEEFYPSECE